MEDNTKKANLIARILFIAGGILLFIVLIILIFKIVPVAISGLSNLRENITSGIRKNISKDEIVVTSSINEVEVKNPIIISFEYDAKDVEGKYYVSYNCSKGLLFDIESKEGPKRIICDTPFVLGTKINSISLIPLFTEKNGFSDSDITITYRDENNKILASGSKNILVKDSVVVKENEENTYTVNNGSLSGSSVTTKPLTTTKPTTTTTYKNPTKDLAITYAASVNSNSTFVIYVYNYGNTSTGPWEFSYTDAENPSRAILSPVQASLSSGQGLAITVRFDGQDNERQTISINIDPYNKIPETNENNNSSSVVITGRNNSGGSYNYNDDADLTITSMKVGRISGNRFISDSEINEDDTAALSFVVKNQGGESTGTWRYELTNLPYNTSDDNYRSSSQSSLSPGESTEIILEFDGIDEGRYSIEVEVDYDDRVDEEDERNNTETETLRVTR